MYVGAQQIPWYVCWSHMALHSDKNDMRHALEEFVKGRPWFEASSMCMYVCTAQYIRIILYCAVTLPFTDSSLVILVVVRYQNFGDIYISSSNMYSMLSPCCVMSHAQQWPSIGTLTHPIHPIFDIPAVSSGVWQSSQPGRMSDSSVVISANWLLENVCTLPLYAD